MNINENNFELFLNTIFRESFYSDSNHKKFMSVGIDPNQWPDFEVKNMMLDYNFLKDSKGVEFAKIALVQKVEKLKLINIPEDLDMIEASYTTTLKLIKTKQLAKKILENPDDVNSLISDFQKNRSSKVELINLRDGIRPALEDLQEKIKNNQALVQLPDFKLLSNSIGGFNPKRVSIITAKSGFGKTKLAINLALSARKIMNTIYYNMEMGMEDFVSLFIQNKTGTENNKWYKGDINFALIEKFIDELSEGKSIFFSDGRSLIVDDIISSIYAKTYGEPMNFIVIDYDQKLITKSRDEEWMAMVRSVEKFEDVAKSTNSHVVILAQADDSGDIKSSKRSQQPASAVLNFFSDGEVPFKKYLIKPLKNRFGPNNFLIEMDYNPSISKITEGNYVEPDSIKKTKKH